MLQNRVYHAQKCLSSNPKSVVRGLPPLKSTGKGLSFSESMKMAHKLPYRPMDFLHDCNPVDPEAFIFPYFAKQLLAKHTWMPCWKVTCDRDKKNLQKKTSYN